MLSWTDADPAGPMPTVWSLHRRSSYRLRSPAELTSTHSDGPRLKQNSSFGHRCLIKIPLFAVKWWQIMIESEKAKEARPLEVVWVALYSVLVLMLMMLCVDVATR